jgi:hypothetical protein
VSELKSTIGEYETKLKQEIARNDELEVYYQEKIQELQAEMEVVKFDSLIL